MAVRKIRKISSWILLAVILATLVILGLFYFGGNDTPLKEDLWTPHYTGLLLNWQYILFVVTIVTMIGFALWQFITEIVRNPKSAIVSLVVIVLFAGLLLVTHSIGDGTPLSLLNQDAQKYNVSLWLKITDMWLYSTYTLTVLVILALVFGSIKKVLK